MRRPRRDDQFISLALPPPTAPIHTFKSLRDLIEIEVQFNHLVADDRAAIEQWAKVTPLPPGPPPPRINPKVPLAVQGVSSWFIALTVTKTDFFKDDYKIDVSPAWMVDVVGPTMDLYHELVGEVMWDVYQNAETNHRVGFGPYTSAPGSLKSSNKSIVNRASIVTMLRRFKLNDDATKSRSSTKEFDMLFTGDAYDRDCNVQNTIAAFDGRDLRQFVHFLKVPHHCSKVTSDKAFYKLFRAHIYLICGAQKAHGNPSLHTLETIAAGFAQTATEYQAELAANGGIANPKLLFFSDPDSLDDIVIEGLTYKSNTWQLLNRDFKPNTNVQIGKPIYNYKCFMLRKQIKKRTGAGRIILGRNDNNGLTVQFTTTTNTAIPPCYELNDWVEMK